VGMILTAMQVDSTITPASLIGLAITFFLFAYRPLDVPYQENEQQGFADLLALMIIPKVLWISTAMSAFGIGFSFFATNEGYKNMLLIGGISIAFATLLLGIFTIIGVKHIRVVAPILLRALPLCLVDFYILFR
jgi:hypothetical protein